MRVAVLLVSLVLPVLADDLSTGEETSLPEGASLSIVVQEVRGEADLRFSQHSEWGPAVKGMTVPVGSEFCTGAGAMVWIAFGLNSVALVREGSFFRIESFRMEHGALVARVHIDPGIASVSVAQQQQFLTNFEVSTPRLTASIRGSGETVVANGDEVADRVFVDEHFADVVTRAGQYLGVAQGGATNSNGQTPHELATLNNIADVTPEGATRQETENVENLTSTSQGTDIVGSNLTFSSTSNPATGPDGPAPEALGDDPMSLVYVPEELDRPDQSHELGHFILQVGDIETDLSHDRDEFRWRWEGMYLYALPDGQDYHVGGDGNGMEPPSYEPYPPDDVPPEWNPEGEWSEANHDRLHEMGVRSFIDDYLLPMIERDAHHDWDSRWNEWVDEETHQQRIAEFHEDAYGEGFDRFSSDLRAAADAAARGELEREALGRILIDVAHMTTHMEHMWHPSGHDEGWQEEHRIIHEEYLPPLLDLLAQGPFEEFVDVMLGIEHQRWHEETELPDTLDPGSREAERHDHFHQHLDEMRETLLPPQPSSGDAE